MSHKRVTSRMFSGRLAEVIDGHKASNLLTIPGIYEILSEHFNDEILARFDNDRALAEDWKPKPQTER